MCVCVCVCVRVRVSRLLKKPIVAILSTAFSEVRKWRSGSSWGCISGKDGSFPRDPDPQGSQSISANSCSVALSCLPVSYKNVCQNSHYILPHEHMFGKSPQTIRALNRFMPQSPLVGSIWPSLSCCLHKDAAFIYLKRFNLAG